MPLQDLSDLELRILARMRQQNLNPYEQAPDRDVSTDDGSETDDPDLERPPSPQAARLGNIDWPTSRRSAVLRVAYIEVHINMEDAGIVDDHTWTWGYLGEGNRRVLPSCVVRRIREQFPSDVYRGFRL
ncbi:hypothetical protein HPB50_029030 [Hyalomma asiaticum]|nr:hypothetical protein HPB50_029030 [Hyalomma asiaticum]